MKPFVFTLSLFSIVNVSATEFPLDNKNTISAGYGLGTFSSNIIFNLQVSAFYDHHATGPFYLKYQHVLTNDISLGINMSWIEDNYNFDYEDSSSSTFIHKEQIHRSFSFLLRADHSIYKSKKFEVYAGFGLGFVSHKGWFQNRVQGVYIVESVSPGFPFSFELTLGERYFVTDRVGIYVEVGFAKSVMQGGLAYRF